MQKWIFAFIYILFINLDLEAKDIIHSVKKGETLYSISRMYNISLDEILTENGIEDPSRIKTGFQLKIPEKTTDTKQNYTVEKGDTLYSIAKKFNLEVKALIDENKIKSGAVIKPGQILVIPGMEAVKGEIAIQEPRQPEQKGITITQNKDFYWPVNGEMEKLSGKLQGSRISAAFGEAVYSVSSGKVVWEGPYRGFGRVIFIESVSGYVYVYGGNDRTSVNVGDSVKPGSEIGKIGMNVYEGKPAMFFAVYKDGQPIDVEKAPRL